MAQFNPMMMPGVDPALAMALASMQSTPPVTKDGKNNNKSKTGKEFIKDGVAYRVYFNASHNESHSIGWMIYVFSVVCLLVGLGLMGGVWNAVPASTRTQSFENFCYSVWAVLGLGIILVTCFVGYFYHVMRQFKLGHEKKFSDIFKK